MGRHPVTWIAAALIAGAVGSARAQGEAPSPIEQVDPDAKRAPRPTPADEDETPTEGTALPTEPEPVRPPKGQPGQVRLPPRGVGARVDAGRPGGVDAPKAAILQPTRPPPKPLKLATFGEADLIAGWEVWRKAEAGADPKAASDALIQLVALRQNLGISDLDAFSVGLQRAANEHARASDIPRAVALASAAVDLAPNLPFAHWRLARMYFAADATDVGRYANEAKIAAVQLWTHPRYGRAELADLGAALLFALMATATAVTLVLFGRTARYFLHDFHHLAPRATALWQTTALALLLLIAPALMRLGLAPVLLTLFAASVLYLSWTERLLAGALIAALGVMPLAAKWLVRNTAFEGTAAEAVFVLDQGGLGADAAAAEVAKRLDADKAEFAEAYALARYELLRGKTDAAMAHFKKAAELRTNDPGVLTNLGNAMLGKADLEGAVDAYTAATKADPGFAPAWFDLSRALERRATSLDQAQAALEQDQAQTARQQAERIDPSLANWTDPPDDALYLNRVVVSPGVRRDQMVALAASGERAGRIQRQLMIQLLGDFDSPWAAVYPLGACALLVLAGALRERVVAAQACKKCGRPVCRRCDPELPPGSVQCGQCVNVFARKSDVPASLRIRKQIEVERHRVRLGRLSYAFGLLLSGAGHLFQGLPIRGAVYAFLFLFAAFNLFFRHGVLRAPYGALPVALRVAPLGAMLAIVYFVSLLGLYRKQAE